MERKDAFYFIYSADNLIKKNVRKGIGDVKLTPGVINILDYLGNHRDVIQKDISDYYREEPASVTSALKYMERNGLIERKENKKDSRAKNIYLTQKGKQALKKVVRLYTEIEKNGLKGFSDKDMKTLSGLLEKLCNNLESYTDLCI